MEGSHHHFSCKTGYSLVGAGTLYCSDQGIWNGSFPTCFIGRQLAFSSYVVISDLLDSTKNVEDG